MRASRSRAIAFLGLLALGGLAACGPNAPIATGFESHFGEPYAEYPTVMYILRPDEAQRACQEVIRRVENTNTEPMGCTTEMPEDHPFAYVVICSSKTVCEHELEHTKRGHWH